MATTVTMESTRFQQASCDLCGFYTWKDHMEHRDEGLLCYDCAQLPPYSDELYNALVLIQRLFRKHFEQAAQPCFNCERRTLKRYEFEGGLVCSECLDELSNHDHDHEHEHDDEPEDEGPCEECGNPHECVCAELREDAYLARHRRICGLPDCDGGCGALDCGCIDKCKCDDRWGDDE